MKITDRGIHNLNLSVLDAKWNKGIKKFSHMTNLTKLGICGRYMIIDDVINCTNLRVLIADFTQLSELNGLTNLRHLSISRNQHIGDEGLKGLNLISLNASKCKNIRNLNTMTTLRSLNISGEECGVSDSGITSLNLKNLYCEGNTKITHSSGRWWYNPNFEIVPSYLKY
jgi:hypothetical protein